MALAIAKSQPAPPPAPRGVQWLDVATAAKRMGISDRRVRQLCVEKWFATGQARQESGGAWSIRDDADVKLARVRFADDIPADLKGLTDAHRARVLCKSAILKAWEEYVDVGVERGHGRESATKAFLEELAAGTLPIQLAKGFKLPTDRTMRNWRSAFRKDGLAGLIDERGTRQSKPTDEDPFFECVKFYLLDPRKRSKQMCWELACGEARRSGWMTRSYKQTLRYIAVLPHDVLSYGRKGPKAFNGTDAAYIERDYSMLRSNEVWCTDEHMFDVRVNYRGETVRPFLVAFEDMRSRKIVGWVIKARSADTDTVLEALHNGCASHGVPERIYCDNGKVFDCAALSGQTKQMRFGKIAVDPGVMAGVLGGLGIAITHAIAFNAKAKPIERFFGTVCDRFSKLQATYCGGTTATRPENLKAKLARGAAPEFEDFVASFKAWLEGDYHARGHTGDSMDGQTPAAVFDAHLVEKRTAPAAVLEVMLWKPSRPTRYTRNGVISDGIGYGNRATELAAWIGKDVIVRVNPSDASKAAICEPSGRLISFAPANVKMPFNTPKADLKEAFAQIQQGKKKTRESCRPKPRVHSDVESQLWANKADAARKAKEAANVPAPSLVMVNTPMSDQLAAVERGTGSQTQIDPYKLPPERHQSFADSVRPMMARLEREREEEQARIAAENDAFNALRRRFRESEAG